MVDEAKTVYVVTSGEYSDYHIDAIFSDEAVAEAYCDRHNRSSAYSYDRKDVEVWEVDEVKVVEQTKIAFRVSYTLVPNGTSWMTGGGWRCSGDPDKDEVNPEVVHTVDKNWMGQVEYRWATEVWADTEAEAKKIGADRIVAFAGSAIQGDEPFPVDPMERRDTPFLNSIKQTPTIVTATWGAKNLTTGEVYKPSEPPTPEEAAIDEEVRKLR